MREGTIVNTLMASVPDGVVVMLRVQLDGEDRMREGVKTFKDPTVGVGLYALTTGLLGADRAALGFDLRVLKHRRVRVDLPDTGETETQGGLLDGHYFDLDLLTVLPPVPPGDPEPGPPEPHPTSTPDGTPATGQTPSP